jgi:hypothetical protein
MQALGDVTKTVPEQGPTDLSQPGKLAKCL